MTPKIMEKKFLERYEKLLKRLAEFDKAIQALDTDKGNAYIGDAIILRFEYAFDMFAQCLNDYLREVIQISKKVYGHKAVMRTCCEMMLCTEDETLLLFDMLEQRLLITDMHQKAVAQKLISLALQYGKIMHIIADRMKINYDKYAW